MLLIVCDVKFTKLGNITLHKILKIFPATMGGSNPITILYGLCSMFSSKKLFSFIS